jgi:hypothetical protein
MSEGGRMREIGSYFWLDIPVVDSDHEEADAFSLGQDRVYVLSGRTALDFVLEDFSTEVRAVYMPSYCCSSMLKPFLDRGVQIYFYDVFLAPEGLQYRVDYGIDVDIFYAMSYFGFESTAMDVSIREFKKRNVTVIEDVTHRLLCSKPCCQDADYLIASLRKWFPIPCGGLAVKTNGHFAKDRLLDPPSGLLEKPIAAMRLKAKYISGSSRGIQGLAKKEYLALFAEFEKDLESNYKLMGMDSLSRYLLANLDIDGVKEKRRGNAEYLYNSLLNMTVAKPLVSDPDFGKDCPLFVPVVVEPAYRNRLRAHLVSKGVYCPVHWPIPSAVELDDRTARLYEQELSLICDQRYCPEELELQIHLLGQFELTVC